MSAAVRSSRRHCEAKVGSEAWSFGPASEGAMPTPVARRTRSSRRSSVLNARPDQTVVDDEVILTPARPAPRSRLSRARAKQPTRMSTRRSSRRASQREGESGAESESDSEIEGEEEERQQREGGRVGEESPTKRAVNEEEEESENEKENEAIIEKGAEQQLAEEEQEDDDDEETESELEETESELEETESEQEETVEENEEDEARNSAALRKTMAMRAQAEAHQAAAAAAAEQQRKAQSAVRKELASEEPRSQSQSGAVVALLVFCAAALLVTSGLLLYNAGGAHGWGDGSSVTTMWSEDSLAFLTDQRIASTVQKDIAVVEAALRQQIADLVSSQVNGKTSKTDARVAELSTELETLLSHVTQIQAQVEEYRRASAAAPAQADDSAATAALEELEASQATLGQKLQNLEAKVSGLKASSSVPAEQQESLEEVHAQLASLAGRLGVLQEAAGDVEALRSDMTRMLLEKQRQHDELVARYTRDLDALLAEVDGAKKDSSTASSAISDLTRSLEDLSVPEMHAIEERVRTVVSAELAKQPVVKPGLERDHVQELINTALARESAGRVEPLSEEEIERMVRKQVSSVESDVAALKHAADTKASAPPPPVISITEEASADIVEGERMRIMAWVQEAIDKARLAPAASAPPATPTPGAPQTPLPYVRPEDINLEEIKSAVMEDVYKLLFADAVGKPDYALASVGGSVVDYSGKWSLGRLAGLLSPFPGRATSVNAIIEKDTSLGACWPMAGSSGFVTVKLAQRVLVDSISIEHVSSTIAHNQESAPRDVRFWGYSTSGSKATFMGQFTYDIHGREVQTFPVQTDTEIAVSLVKLEVLSNHGHPDYTCIYRLRVHGSPVELQL